MTYGELIPELKRKGMRLNVPLIPRASKSGLTSCLEREPRLIPKYQYDYVDPLLTLEVVYGTGEAFRTGSASGPGTLETLKADKVNPWGPGSVDYFRFLSSAQGTMGLVTWAATKTEVLPVLQKLYSIPIEHVDKLTAPMNLLLKKRVVDEGLALNRVNLATILAESWPRDFEDLKTALPPWTVLACVAGYERRPEQSLLSQPGRGFRRLHHRRIVALSANFLPHPYTPYSLAAAIIARRLSGLPSSTAAAPVRM